MRWLNVIYCVNINRVIQSLVKDPGLLQSHRFCKVDLNYLSERVAEYRWKMLGHVLRSDENTAAHHYCAVETLDCAGRRGAPQANLFTVLKQDLEYRHLYFRTFEEFNELRDIARCRTCWRNCF